MQPTNSSKKDELDVVKDVRDLLLQLPADARERALNYVLSLYKADYGPSQTPVSRPNGMAPLNGQNAEAPFTETFDEFIERVDPQSNSDTALAAGYWIQVKEQSGSFTANEVNSLLKNLGRNIKHITNTYSVLQRNKPSYVIQIKKKGSSKQARKIYKVTTAGISAVNNMIKQEIES